jgi:hypothetical protein
MPLIKQQIAAFSGIFVILLSYPTWVLWHLYDYTEKPVQNPLDEESMAILADRKRRREAGEFSVLQYEMGKIYDNIDYESEYHRSGDE